MNQVAPELPQTMEEGRARAVALTAGAQLETEPTSIVTYLSRGRLLIIGEPKASVDVAVIDSAK